MEPAVKIVGIGPGDERYISPIARELIDSAEVLVGGRRQLESLASPHQEQYVIGANLPAVLEFIESRRHKKVVVLASGDPGLFSIAAYLTQHLDKDRLEIFPGISSVQLMFARLKMPWQEVRILSLHGRQGQDLGCQFNPKGITALLTGGEWTPRSIARFLSALGLPDYEVAIGQDLSYPEEKIIMSTLSELAGQQEDYSNCVMVVFHD